MATLCVECGPNVRIDSDGCCWSCGGNAIGTWLDRVSGDRREYDKAPDEESTIESVRFVRNILAASVAELRKDLGKAERKLKAADAKLLAISGAVNGFHNGNGAETSGRALDFIGTVLGVPFADEGKDDRLDA